MEWRGGDIFSCNSSHVPSGHLVLTWLPGSHVFFHSRAPVPVPSAARCSLHDARGESAHASLLASVSFLGFQPHNCNLRLLCHLVFFPPIVFVFTWPSSFKDTSHRCPPSHSRRTSPEFTWSSLHWRDFQTSPYSEVLGVRTSTHFGTIQLIITPST